ncbi:hypothetical protein ADLECEL_21000 [Adlercreutzia equolifaciens subsp. celatus]|nr:hypothetical protein ADLECEL_21000 [Adlercreutzia equolifaciens subsp. celatus]
MAKRLLARVAGAGAGRRAVSGLHRSKALGLGGNARSRTGGCGGVRRSSGAGRRRSERALGRSGLLGSASLAGLQLGSGASGKARSASRRALRDILRSGTTMGCCTDGAPCTQASTSDCAGIGMLLGVHPLPAGAGRDPRPRGTAPAGAPAEAGTDPAGARPRRRMPPSAPELPHPAGARPCQQERPGRQQQQAPGRERALPPSPGFRSCGPRWRGAR